MKRPTIDFDTPTLCCPDHGAFRMEKDTCPACWLERCGMPVDRVNCASDPAPPVDTLADLVDMIAHMVWHACTYTKTDDGYRIYSDGNRTYANAIRLLADAGRLEIMHEDGDNVIARPAPK